MAILVEPFSVFSFLFLFFARVYVKKLNTVNTSGVLQFASGI
jgi:hypothetical protein